MTVSDNRGAEERASEAERLTKAEILMHPVRLRLVMALAGREMTTQQLGEALPDIAKASLYRHMRRLNEAGVVRVVRETPVRGTLEKVYAVQNEAARLNPQELANISAEEHTRFFNAFVASLLAQFRVVAQEAGDKDLIAGGVAYSTNSFYLNDEEYQEVVEEIRAALYPRLANAPDGERRRRLISVIVLPDSDAEPQKTE